VKNTEYMDWLLLSNLILAFATALMALAILMQTRYIGKQTKSLENQSIELAKQSYAMFQSMNTQNRLIIAQIETVWMPEVIHRFSSAQREGDDIFVFRRNRPWYPRIRAVIEGEEIECKVQVMPGTSKFYELVEEKEYSIVMPKELHELFMRLEPREETYKGKISLEFYSMARNKYMYHYEIEILRESDHYKIVRTDLLDVNVPWS